MSFKGKIHIALSSIILFPLSYLAFKQYKFAKAKRKIIFNGKFPLEKIKQFLPKDVRIRKTLFSLNKGNYITLINYSNNEEIAIKKAFNFNKLESIKNFFSIKEVCDFPSLREEFRYLENPKHKIILITKNTLDNIGNEYISKFHNLNTKIISINNNQLISDLQISPKENKIYEYFPYMFPFSLAKPESLKKELLSLQFSNPVSLMLKYGLFRNEYNIVNQKSLLIDNGVIELAAINKNQIKENLTKKGCHLFILTKKWNNLKEGELEDFLNGNIEHFNSVNITKSKEFAKSVGLYQYNQISDSIPQIFIQENKEHKGGSNDKKIYNIGIFSLKNDFKLFLKNQLPQFSSENTPIKMPSFVEEITGKEFLEKIKNDSSFNECVVQFSKENCPPCFMLGITYDHLSLKFKKHQITKTRLFRIDVQKNEIPFLGELNATPTFLHLIKNSKGNITQITPLDTQNFITKLKEVSQNDLTNIKYHSNVAFGYFLYVKRYFEKNNYDPDIDLNVNNKI